MRLWRSTSKQGTQAHTSAGVEIQTFSAHFYGSIYDRNPLLKGDDI